MTSNPKQHSFSRIDTFQGKCERQSAYSAILGKWVTTPAQARGSHVHDGFEAAAKKTLRHNGHPRMFADDALDAVIAAPPEGPLPAKKFADYMNRFRPIFKHLKPSADDFGNPRVEEWFKEIGGRKVVGKIDLISDQTPVFDGYGVFTGTHIEKPCVIDYKTTGNPRSIKDQYQAAKSLQLQIYSLATGIPRSGFIYFLPSGEPRGAIVDFSESDLVVAKQWLFGTMDVINARWDDAVARALVKGEDHEDVVVNADGAAFDITTFALASVGHPLCCAKWCDFHDRCLGRKA